MKDLPVIEHWYNFNKWLLERTNNFPKKIRFTITSRIDNISLMILEMLIEARYRDAKTKRGILATININIEKLRFLLRLANESRYLPMRSYEYAMRQLQEAGIQVGAWLKSLQHNEKT